MTTDGDPIQELQFAPTSGAMATSTSSYRSVYLEALPESHTSDELVGPIDVGAIVAQEQDVLYSEPAVGVIATTEQKWIPTEAGLGLGRLLHTLTLAPGESTRVAMVDWSRRVAARATQATSQIEAVAEQSDRQTAMSDITESVAQEEQFGSTAASSRATSKSRGGTSGTSFMFGLLGSSGGSHSSSQNESMALNVSRSSGSRSIGSTSAQRIQERTEQLATSSRDMRATVVHETSEAESTTASTRVVTNYNHMHALTMQYWQVLQSYRLVTTTKRCERCLFIPMSVLTFDSYIFRRYASVLAAAAPERWATKIASIDPLEFDVYRTPSSNGSTSDWNKEGRHPQEYRPVSAPNKLRTLLQGPWKVGGKGKSYPLLGILANGKGAVLSDGLEDWVFFGSSPERRFNRNGDFGVWVDGTKWRAMKAGGPLVPHGDERRSGPVTDKTTGFKCRLGPGGIPKWTRDLKYVPAKGGPTGAKKLSVWSDDDGRISKVLVLLRDDKEVVIGEDSSERTECSMDFSDTDDIRQINLHRKITNWGPEIRHIEITTSAGMTKFLPNLADDTPPLDGKPVAVTCSGGELCGLFGSVDPMSKRIVSLGFQLRGPHVAQEILDHLNDNRLHYSRAVWANLDELTLAMIQSKYRIPDFGKDVTGADEATPSVPPLGLRLDPMPVAMTGNYLGFRWHFDDEDERKEWAKEREEGASEETTVSIPTDGVWGEAALGRANAAEKLDITRFWDWQSSPIPIKPPELAPVDTGSRARDVDLRAGELAPIAAAIHALSSVPEAHGTVTALREIATGGMFRDMSGVHATVALLQKGIEAAASGDAESGKRAGEAMAEANRHLEKMAELGIDAAKEIGPMLAGGPAGAIASPSKLGAMLNFTSDVADEV